MGLLRKELIDTFGPRDGAPAAAAVRLRRRLSRRRQPARPVELGRSARRAARRRGRCTRSKASCASRSCARRIRRRRPAASRQEVVWHDSYVAEQHLHHYGQSTAPVCWSLVGYASGYASACLGQEIYFRETDVPRAGRRSAVRSSAAMPPAGATTIEALRADFQGAGPRARSRAAARRGAARGCRSWTGASGCSSSANAS